MILRRYLIVGKRRHQKPVARISVNPPALDSHEIAIKLEMDIPEELFSKPQLSAKITVPKDAISSPVIDADVVDNIEEIISRELGVDMSISVLPNDQSQ